ncbi:MAG: hypothetical protein OEY52_13655 [Gammaproteobacteria bacterium]|nr:hypothetical protein [Gammaproteobacteria bacterium]
MATPITIIAPIKLAQGKTEADLLAASNRFQEEFAGQQAGILRRELVRKSENEYLDIIQFRSEEDALDVIEKEKQSTACHDFFAVMDMSGVESSDEAIDFYPSLVTYS